MSGSVAPAPALQLRTRREFLAGLRAAVEQRHGYAAGKIGHSEKIWLYYPLLLGRGLEARARVAYEAALVRHSFRRAWLFPAESGFLLRYARFYGPHLQNLDCVGLFGQHRRLEAEIVDAYGLTGRVVAYPDQEPDRSSPDDRANYYLPSLRDRRLLLVCPFARLLQERATRTTFEAVWARTGKRWFHPATVEAVEFPYGFSPETESRYGTALALLDDIQAQVAAREFDVALIAAGGLGIPLASFAKSLGKVGLSLGGHLQVLFGVIGERWRRDPAWRELYFNDAWIDMPPRYKPKPGESDENYW